MGWQKRKDIMLCQPLDEHNLDRNFDICPVMLVQPKLDGQRCWVKWENTEEGFFKAVPTLISSQGNVIEGVPHINIALRKLSNLIGQLTMWDGELYVHKMPFESIVSRTKRLINNLHEDYLSIQFHIFDYKSTGSNAERAMNIDRALSLWADQSDTDIRYCLQPVETKKSSREEISHYMDLFISQGYEGIIVRNPAVPYVERRPFTILKWKPSLTDYYKIIRVGEAISEEGQPLGLIGWLECKDRYGNTFRVGSGLGLNNDKKKQLWTDREMLIGQWACVKYQNLTKCGVPRFGKFTSITIEHENNEKENW